MIRLMTQKPNTQPSVKGQKNLNDIFVPLMPEEMTMVRGGMQIFIKTLSGKTITLEQFTPEHINTGVEVQATSIPDILNDV